MCLACFGSVLWQLYIKFTKRGLRNVMDMEIEYLWTLFNVQTNLYGGTNYVHEYVPYMAKNTL